MRETVAEVAQFHCGQTLLLRHRDFLQLFKAADPEIFVDVQVALVALRRARVRAEKVERRLVRQHDRIARRFHVGRFMRKLRNCIAGIRAPALYSRIEKSGSARFVARRRAFCGRNRTSRRSAAISGCFVCADGRFDTRLSDNQTGNRETPHIDVQSVRRRIRCAPRCSG